MVIMRGGQGQDSRQRRHQRGHYPHGWGQGVGKVIREGNGDLGDTPVMVG